MRVRITRDAFLDLLPVLQLPEESFSMQCPCVAVPEYALGVALAHPYEQL